MNPITCPGPLVWFDAPPNAAEDAHGECTAGVLECACCGYIVVTGNCHDEAHADTPLMREGLAA